MEYTIFKFVISDIYNDQWSGFLHLFVILLDIAIILLLFILKIDFCIFLSSLHWRLLAIPIPWTYPFLLFVFLPLYIYITLPYQEWDKKYMIVYVLMA